MCSASACCAHEQIARGAAKGIGNPVFYVGPATGRDGLAGAAFASQDLTEESQAGPRRRCRSAIRFMEKLCCEACLELLATDAVAGIQDMGAAGLTCSTCETASRAGTGIEIELAKVPQARTEHDALRDHAQRIAGAHADHRQKGREQEVKRHLRQVGSALGGSRRGERRRHDARARSAAQIVAEIPASKLADEAPLYEREHASRAPRRRRSIFRTSGNRSAATLCSSCSRTRRIASKNWV